MSNKLPVEKSCSTDEKSVLQLFDRNAIHLGKQ